MTSVAVAPGSLGAPPSMLTPQMYHLQQGLSPTSGSPASGKVSRKKNPPADISRARYPIYGAAIWMRSARESACRMRDASYAGVLHNGTKPRLKSWNLIRGRLLRDAELVRHRVSRGSQGELFWCCISPRGLIENKERSIEYFFQYTSRNIRTLL